MLFNHRKETEQGFTLTELLVVILIIGILAAIAIPLFMNQRKAAREAAVKSDLKNVATQVEGNYDSKEQRYKHPVFITKGSGDSPSVNDESQFGPLSLSQGNTMGFSGDSDKFCLVAFHQDETENKWYFNSEDGGISNTSCGATGDEGTDAGSGSNENPYADLTGVDALTDFWGTETMVSALGECHPLYIENNRQDLIGMINDDPRYMEINLQYQYYPGLGATQEEFTEARATKDAVTAGAWPAFQALIGNDEAKQNWWAHRDAPGMSVNYDAQQKTWAEYYAEAEEAAQTDTVPEKRERLDTLHQRAVDALAHYHYIQCGVSGV